jgi:hypothetical protein
LFISCSNTQQIDCFEQDLTMVIINNLKNQPKILFGWLSVMALVKLKILTKQ